jgi:ABC-2 type transport system ATP-binding protein
MYTKKIIKGSPDPMKAVEVNHLYKSYADVTAVNDLTFAVDPGEILGLIGPNGAGKSTTIKVVLDFMRPDSGEVKIFGQHMNEALKDQIGYLPEESGLYKKLTAIDLILYLASLKGMDKTTAEKKANVLLEQTGMLEYKKKKNKEMSRGMGQLIQFIVTVIHDPELIILDEPFSGLDPVRTETVQNIIGSLRDEGKAIILSTHQMNKVEELCDRVLMINKGQTVLYGDLMETRAKFRRNSVQVDTDGELGDLPGVIDRKLKNGSVELVLAPDTTPQTILDRIRDRGITITRFEVTTPSLNEIFLNLVGVDHE